MVVKEEGAAIKFRNQKMQIYSARVSTRILYIAASTVLGENKNIIIW